jgi:2-desacetyl-2-hydroxyethyl bacteriochlorophyllide A dehydrogenase
MPLELVITGPKKIGFREYHDGDLKPSEVRLKTLASGISHGTEMNYYRGTVQFGRKKFDQDLRMFVEGPPSVPYPATVGYENVSIVTEVGSEVETPQKGDRVWVFRRHRETNIVPQEEARSGLLPKEVSNDQGIFSALAVVGLGAVHDARIKVGDNVAVFGLGTVGLITAQIAKRNGARRVFAADVIDKRLRKAEEYGCIVLNPKETDVAQEIKRQTKGKGVDVAIETSGTYRAVHQAIRSCQKAGTVVTVGFYQGGGSDLFLGEEWHHNRITMLSSMTSWDCPHRDFPLWDHQRLLENVMELFSEKKLLVEDLITQRVPFKEAAKAYALIDEHPEETIKVELVYS